MVRDARTSARSKSSSEAESGPATAGDDPAWLSRTLRHHSPRVRPQLVQRLSSVVHSSSVTRVLMVRPRTAVGDFMTLNTPGPLDGARVQSEPCRSAKTDSKVK